MQNTLDAGGGAPPETSGGARRLGLNLGGYRGEAINPTAVIAASAAAARAAGWTVEELLPGPAPILGLRRPASPSAAGAPAPRRVYLSAGIHGDEPAGPLAALQLLQEDLWPAGTDLWLCPCLNPAGFALNQRENAGGLDLNRHFRAPSAAETVAHVRWLEAQPGFDVCLCLHEDWESNGFYLYELNPEDAPSLAGRMVEAAARVCPIDTAEVIEGRAARGGLIRPSLDPRSRPDWPEAFYLLTWKTRLSYTLEAPSDFALPVRVAALVAAVRAALSPG